MLGAKGNVILYNSYLRSDKECVWDGFDVRMRQVACAKNR